MAEQEERSNTPAVDRLREQWREVLARIDDRILRACLPKKPEAIVLTQEQITIIVDSEFKKEYCVRKQEKLQETIAQVMGPHRLVISEPPLIERAQGARPKGRINARIAVLGIGDGGVNAVGRMHDEHLHGVRLISLDTDKQVLGICKAHETLQLGLDITGGRGTGGDEEKGKRAAMEARWEIGSLLKGVDLVFITAGMGGGTGTAAAPVIAKIAKENGALTIAVVTKPFSFEGAVRRTRAESGLERLQEAADVLIAISNDRLLETGVKGLAVTKAFELADEILHQGVRGISDLVTIRGLVNLDFADIRSVLADAGEAMMGMGSAQGEQRAVTAAKLATTNPLLEGGSIRGARKMIMNVTGGEDLSLGEVTAAADLIRRVAATECDLVFGAVVQSDFSDGIKITVIAADFKGLIEEELERKASSLRRPRVTLDNNIDLPAFLRKEQRESEKDD
ncbi:cell division protein FtsZ [Candidatus Bipolaricaulota bacterium]|nr:cell division protein FtsZ [Candidatus Bipolaricaulota bacterium]